MATLAAFNSESSLKFLYLGDSKTGKTGSLASLVRAGYSLYVIDFDNGLDYLASELSDDKEALARVHFATFRDKRKITTAKDVVIDGKAKAFADALDTIDNGIDDSGPLKDLGPKDIVVIDSLWAAGEAALFEHMKSQPSKDKRQNYGGAQQLIMALLNNLTDPEFKPNVIVITHMTLIEMREGIQKNYPAAIGKAICEDIPKLFNRMIVAEIKGAGRTARRVISTVPTQDIAATSGEVKGKVPDELPIETGLADLFKTIKGEQK